MTHKINLRDYSRYPGPRFKKHGPNSAEVFLKDVLLPAMEKFDKIKISVDGIQNMPYSFLCAIGRTMIEEKVLTYTEHVRRITLESPDGSNQKFVSDYNNMRDFYSDPDNTPE